MGNVLQIYTENTTELKQLKQHHTLKVAQCYSIKQCDFTKEVLCNCYWSKKIDLKNSKKTTSLWLWMLQTAGTLTFDPNIYTVSPNFVFRWSYSVFLKIHRCHGPRRNPLWSDMHPHHWPTRKYGFGSGEVRHKNNRLQTDQTKQTGN